MLDILHTVRQIKQTVTQIQPLPCSFCIKLQTNIAKNQSLKYWHRHLNSQRAKQILKSFLLTSLFFVLITLAIRRSQAIEVNEKNCVYPQRDLERNQIPAQVARARNARMEARKPVKCNKAHQLQSIFPINYKIE